MKSQVISISYSFVCICLACFYPKWLTNKKHVAVFLKMEQFAWWELPCWAHDHLDSTVLARYTTCTFAFQCELTQEKCLRRHIRIEWKIQLSTPVDVKINTVWEEIIDAIILHFHVKWMTDRHRTRERWDPQRSKRRREVICL